MSLIAVGMLLFAAGCGGSAAGPVDEGLAQSSLAAALDAWKGGKLPSELARASPAINVGDSLWEDGWKLVNYKVHGPAKSYGVHIRVPVTLTVQKPPKKSQMIKGTYVVASDPVISVIRENQD
jgi:hypothetical protein